MLTLNKIEYIDYRDKIRLSLKLFGVFNVIFILNNMSNNNTYKSNFQKTTSVSKITFYFNEEKQEYNLTVSILKFLKINENIPIENIIANTINENNSQSDNMPELPNITKLNEILELSCTENHTNNFYDLELEYPIDIVIPVFNGFKYLKDLFNSIFKNTNINYRLIIVNDCSTDENVYNYLKTLSNEEYPYCKEIILLNNNENLGFIKSVNKGCNYVKNHFVLLNTDVIVPTDWLNRLMYPIIINNNIASVTPFTNSGTICSFPIFCQDNELFLNLDVKTLDNIIKTTPKSVSYKEIPTAVGFCMAINKNVFDNVGDLDTIFGKGYGEENDWCMRASEKGYKHLIACNLFVFHNHGGSFVAEEKKSLLEKNLNILANRYPFYNKMIAEYVSKDEIKPIRYYNIIKILFEQKNLKTNIVFTHNIGGGTEIYLTNYIKDKIDNEIFIIIKEYSLLDFYHNKSKYIFNLKYKNIDIELIFYNLYEIMTILDSFNIKTINNIIINHLISFNLNKIVFFILNLKNKYKAEIIFKVHDFLAICKRHNLLYKDKYFCDIPKDFSICKECLNDFDIEEYRKYFEVLLINSTIETFSNSSKNLIMKAYKNVNSNNIIVNPHKIDWINRKAKNTNNTNDLRVGILGIISFHKGFFILEKLLNLVKEDNITFYSFGQCDLVNNKLINVGEYNHNNIVDLVDQYDIDVFIMTSIWPETFSYTTEEIILMDKPIIIFNLGAPAERVVNYNKGYIVDEVSAEAMYKELLKFYKNNKVVTNE